MNSNLWAKLFINIGYTALSFFMALFGKDASQN